MNRKPDPTPQRIRELLTYDQNSGAFHWKARAGVHRTGRIAGSLCRKDGYVIISIDRTKRPAHRLAWAYVYGEWPKRLIDHINGVRTDNRIANLRDVDQSTNLQNRKRPTENSYSGVLGAHYSKSKRRYYASILVRGKVHRLGSFLTAAEAGLAYQNAKRRLHEGYVE
ncbi:HNH endonuclease [Achromobacter sp. GG226]|uniref:HNH endonuclease n=1 Tax=Verticiella alkaliphila TaxID=2779529 RepID=UPI001C0BC93B|nr:HNH endonuclease [Verticiella sp. GG226]MBU4609190.1 HNH endonuclease [Verticiella sp. GG226]